MHRRVALDLRWLAFFLLCLWGSSAHGVIFDSTGDPTFNTTAPSGSLTGSGWQYQGLWGGFLGTPVAPQYFVTAKHVGGTIGQDLVLNGISYTTVAVSNDPNSDL